MRQYALVYTYVTGANTNGIGRGIMLTDYKAPFTLNELSILENDLAQYNGFDRVAIINYFPIRKDNGK